MVMIVPGWYSKYVETMDGIKKLRDISNDLKILYEERTKSLFDDKINFHHQKEINGIQGKVKEVINKKLLKRCQINILSISKMDITNEMENKIRKNIQSLLVNKVKEITSILNKQENEYYDKLQTYKIDPKINEDKKEYNPDSNFSSELDPELVQVVDSRNLEISNIAKSINDLAILFKEVSVLTIEQGSIIEQIDSNLDHTLTHSKKANQQLIIVF